MSFNTSKALDDFFKGYDAIVKDIDKLPEDAFAIEHGIVDKQRFLLKSMRKGILERFKLFGKPTLQEYESAINDMNTMMDYAGY